MKDMDLAKQILVMHIVQDKTKRLLWISQEKYATKVLQRFNMENAKLVGLTSLTNYKFFGRQCLKSKTEKAKKSKVSYASVVESLMYMMVCTRPDFGYVVGVVNRYMINLRR